MTDADWSSDSATMRVVKFVADRTETDPATLAPLGRQIDADAFDRLVDSLADREYVRIEYEGLVLYVWGDGDVTAEEV